MTPGKRMAQSLSVEHCPQSARVTVGMGVPQRTTPLVASAQTQFGLLLQNVKLPPVPQLFEAGVQVPVPTTHVSVAGLAQTWVAPQQIEPQVRA